MSSLPPPPPYSPNDPNTSANPSPNAAAQTPVTPVSPTLLTPPASLTIPTISTNGPSHDYSAYEQSSPGLTETDDTHDGGSFILTPPLTPNGLDHQTNNVEDVHDSTQSSSVLYFESRPTIMRRPSSLTSHHLSIHANDGPDTIPFPEPEQRWLARDVSRLDWATFLNHLFPEHLANVNADIADRKLRAELMWARGAEGEIENEEQRIAQLASLPGMQELSEKQRLVEADAQANGSPSRQQQMEFVVAEWNEGFFQPRGFQIEAEIALDSPLAPLESLGSQETLSHGINHLQTHHGQCGQVASSSSSSLQTTDRDSHGRFGPFGIFRASSRSFDGSQGCSSRRDFGRGPPWAASSGGCSRGRVQAPPCARAQPSPGSEARANETAPSPITCAHGQPCSCRENRRLKAAQWVGDEQPGRRRHRHGGRRNRGRASSVSSLSSTSSSDGDDDDDNDRETDSMGGSTRVGESEPSEFQDLRTTLARFLLNARSKEDAIVAIEELSKEIKGQRKESVRKLKTEAKSHMELRRAERQQWKDAKRTRDQEKRERKEEARQLKRREKEARRGCGKGKKPVREAELAQQGGTELQAQESGVLQAS
ncbi:MAG: hypothetical protein M1825_006325 [Sarcosagium campestre]|nr:MAG: hypothetical protein M1825_006325 [Sarcosagium campestre]